MRILKATDVNGVLLLCIKKRPALACVHTFVNDLEIHSRSLRHERAKAFVIVGDARPITVKKNLVMTWRKAFAF